LNPQEASLNLVRIKRTGLPVSLVLPFDRSFGFAPEPSRRLRPRVGRDPEWRRWLHHVEDAKEFRCNYDGGVFKLP